MTRAEIGKAEFEAFLRPLVGLTVSHIWQGYGSAIFLEFGLLTPREQRRRDGSPYNPRGEFTLIIEWSWRVEGKRRIWCGSGSERGRWPRALQRLQDKRVTAVSLVGRLPEIDLELSNRLHVVSFMTAEGDPQWGVIKRQGGETISVGILAGRLVLESKALEPPQPQG